MIIGYFSYFIAVLVAMSVLHFIFMRFETFAQKYQTILCFGVGFGAWFLAKWTIGAFYKELSLVGLTLAVVAGVFFYSYVLAEQMELDTDINK